MRSGGAGAEPRSTNVDRAESHSCYRRAGWATASARRRKTTRSEMDSKEQRAALRAAVYRGDGTAVVHLLHAVDAFNDSLQLAGDGVIAAVMQRVDGASGLARGLVVALRQRGWDGDDELADQLDALLGSGPAVMLRALPVDLEELAGILEGDPLSAGGRIDMRTGEVWPQAAIEYALESGEEDEDAVDDPERWLPVHGEGSRQGYRDVELFIGVGRGSWPCRAPGHRDQRPRRVSPLQGRARPLARRA
jgi:hypothetical protein